MRKREDGGEVAAVHLEELWVILMFAQRAPAQGQHLVEHILHNDEDFLELRVDLMPAVQLLKNKKQKR